MRRCLVHVQVSRENSECGIPLLEMLKILVQNLFGKLAVFGHSAHVVFITNLQNQFMEQFLLLTRPDFLIIIFNPSVVSGLFSVLPL